MEDGRMAALAYSTLELLVAGCGPDQAWIAAPVEELENLKPLAGFDVKVPVVGGLLATGQTVYDVMNDDNKSAGAIAQHVGADMGGFVAGTAATEGAMALAATIGVAGGPVTLAAVGIGIGVACGVGEVVNHWPEISHWAGDTASDVGHGVENATKAVGNFFSSVF
nr:SAV_915 family protein [Amycolatopsis sp.]